MKILITNIWISMYSGTEVSVRDLSVALHRKGHHVEVFSPILGKVAEEIREAGIHITDQREKLREKPDIIHAKHYIPAMEAIAMFPDVPVIYFLHDRTHIIDSPPPYSGIVKYVAVDYNCLDRLIIDNGIPPERTDVLLNWVDTDKFRLRKHFSEQPKRALVFSNYAKKDNHYQIIKNACDQYGIELDVIGGGFGKNIKDPENQLQNYDIVFAKAKAAIEAMATGAAVILCDFRGLGEMVNTRNFDHFRQYNFGMKMLSNPVEEDSIIREIQKYDATETRKISRRIIKEADFGDYLLKITELYRDVIREYNSTEFIRNKEEDQRRIFEYLDLRQRLHGKVVKDLQLELNQRQQKIREMNARLVKLHEQSKEPINHQGYDHQNDKILKSKNQLQLYHDHILNLKKEISDLEHSFSYRLGRTLTYPLRFLYEMSRRK